MPRARTVSLLATATLTCVAATTLSAPLSARAATIPTPGHPVSHDENPRVPEGSLWTKEYFPSSDGSDVVLHADVLRPANLAQNAKTPVVLSVGGPTSPTGARPATTASRAPARRSGSTTSSRAPT